MAVLEKHIAFDVVGTLVSFSAFHMAIAKAIGSEIAPYNINPSVFGHAWMTDAEIEFTFLSMSGGYTPYKDVMNATFYRTLHFAGVPHPTSLVTERQREACVRGYFELGLRDGAEECVNVLKRAGFKVWAFTSGDKARVQGYFDRAGIEAPEIMSCDNAKVAKPALKAYEPVLDSMRERGGKELWFAAAHHWDVSAATKAGFRGAYCKAYEGDGLWDVHEKIEVVGETLMDMARKIVEKSESDVS